MNTDLMLIRARVQRHTRFLFRWQVQHHHGVTKLRLMPLFAGLGGVFTGAALSALASAIGALGVVMLSVGGWGGAVVLYIVWRRDRDDRNDIESLWTELEAGHD